MPSVCKFDLRSTPKMSSARLCHKQVGQAMQWSWKNVWGRTAQRLVAQAASVDVPAPPDRATDSTAPLDEAYGASKIQVLEGLEPVRKRPGMYIGSTGQKGLHHLIWEIVDNCIDEVQGGHGDAVTVHVDTDSSWVTVTDNGRGIPTDRHPATGKPALETVLTVLHAGGKFGSGGYAVSGGLHGVGLSVVNALSEELEVSVWRQKQLFQQRFACGKPLADMTTHPATEDRKGTQIRFKYDSSIFSPGVSFDSTVITRRLRELAFLNGSATINFKALQDGQVATKEEFHYEGGIAAYVEHINADSPVLHDCMHFKVSQDDSEVEVALQWCSTSSETMVSFVNCIRTIDGGSHVDGLKQAVTRTINKMAKEKGQLKEGATNLSGDHVREGLTAIVSVKVPDPEFEGQTKTRLGNPGVKALTSKIVSESLEDFLRINTDTLRVIVEKALLAQKAADAAKRAREMVKRKTVLTRAMLPGKLADCSSQDPHLTEIFIVEGDSAGGSAKQARDRQFQAILPLRGKILNVEKADDDAIYKNKELSDLILALGLRIRGDSSKKSSDGSSTSEEDDPLEALRYRKIVLLTDADVDGAHIRTLLLTFLYRYEPQLFDKGHVYVGLPPLYKVETRNKVVYCYDDAEKEKVVAGLKGAKHSLQRFKGLGEMMPSQLWDTTMNPIERKLLRLTNMDVAGTESTLQALMGGDASKRRDLITQAGHTVLNNLDV